MTTRAVYLNAGRGTKMQAAKAWALVAAQLGPCPESEILLAVEVDEGDKGYSDHALIRKLIHLRRRIFKGAEVILTRGPGWSNPQVYKGGRSVKHWSRNRPVSVIDKQDGNALVRYFTLHPAAGTKHQKHSRRPGWARPLLNQSWDRTIDVLVRELERAYELGMSSVVMLDANDREFLSDLRARLTRKLAKNLVVLFADSPDFGIAIPARGWTVNHSATTHPQPIERIHSIHVVELEFVKS